MTDDADGVLAVHGGPHVWNLFYTATDRTGAPIFIFILILVVGGGWAVATGDGDRGDVARWRLELLGSRRSAVEE